MTLNSTTILHELRVTHLPRRVEWYAHVPSTMDLARQALATLSDAELPLLVGADEQTAGRGRRGRVWLAPPASALLFSLALRPYWLAPADAGVLVWLMGVALCAAIREVTGLEPRLKWPNDALLEGGKVAGVLLESGTTGTRLEHVIIGCGINIAASPPTDTVRYPATHLDAHTTAPVDRLTLLRALLLHLDAGYGDLLRDGEPGRTRLFAAWQALLVTPGTAVQVETSSGMLSGIAEEVEPDGALRLRDASGQIHRITSGDVFG